MAHNDGGNSLTLEKIQSMTSFVAIITSFLIAFSGSAINLAIPPISEEFHSSATLTGWIVNAFILVSAALSVPFGRVADLAGKKRILVPGILVFSLMSVAIVFSGSIETMIFLRALHGIGIAMIASTNVAILIDVFPPEKRGKVLGSSTAAVYIGLSVGPVMGGLLTHYLGWRSIFIFSAVLGFVVFFAALKNLPETGRERGEGRFDLPGNIMYVGMIACLMYGFSAFAESWAARSLMAAGAALALLFVFHERRAKSPIIEIRLFSRNAGYIFANLAALLNYGATFAVGYLLSIFLQVIKGYDTQAAGLILISQPLMMAVVSVIAGKLSERFQPSRLASAGMGIGTVGLFLFAFISQSYSLLYITISLAVLGIGFGLFSSPNTNAIMSCVEAKDYGVASSIIATMRSMGQTSSMAIVTLIFATTLGNASFANASPELLVLCTRICFWIFTAECVVGTIFSLQYRKPAAAAPPSA
ncbi:MAG: MFS transporter [Clostridiales Family XIII bacterium]|jgi:MFS family permease|nr:MFS transporter [Clostridiales Family XIII bacterium]